MTAPYTPRDLLEQFVKTKRPPPHGLAAFADWEEQRFEAMRKAFGLTWSAARLNEPQQLLWRTLKEALDGAARLRTPTSGWLEASLSYERHGEALALIDGTFRAMQTFYLDTAERQLKALHGDLGTRTDADLRRAGLDPAREPKLDDYLDEI
jgi:hypothetical protein